VKTVAQMVMHLELKSVACLVAQMDSMKAVRLDDLTVLLLAERLAHSKAMMLALKLDFRLEIPLVVK
jgi:hypothetical protein